MKWADQSDDRKAKGYVKGLFRQKEQHSYCVVVKLYKVLGGCEIIDQLRGQQKTVGRDFQDIKSNIFLLRTLKALSL